MNTSIKDSRSRTVFESARFDGKIVFTPAPICRHCGAGVTVHDAFAQWADLCRALELLGPPAAWADESEILEELTTHLGNRVHEVYGGRYSGWPCWCTVQDEPGFDDAREVMP